MASKIATDREERTGLHRMFLRARPGMPYSSASQTEDQIVVVVVVVVFWPCHEACRVLVPQPGIEPMPPAVEAWSLNHWTAREV